MCQQPAMLLPITYLAYSIAHLIKCWALGKSAKLRESSCLPGLTIWKFKMFCCHVKTSCLPAENIN